MKFIASVAQKNYVPTFPAEQKAQHCFVIENNMEKCQGRKVEKNPNLPQAEGMKMLSDGTKYLSAFSPAASEIRGSCSQLTGSPSDGEKTKAESVNLNLQNEVTIKH